VSIFCFLSLEAGKHGVRAHAVDIIGKDARELLLMSRAELDNDVPYMGRGSFGCLLKVAASSENAAGSDGVHGQVAVEVCAVVRASRCSDSEHTSCGNS